uniref:Secreted protein n=1 Tax=Haemonchus placei TaxID=6290 RepID=A0A0N4WW89_HAEPC
LCQLFICHGKRIIENGHQFDSFIRQLRSLLYYFEEIIKLFVVGLCFRCTHPFFYQCSTRSGRLLGSCCCRHSFRLRLWGPTISGHVAWLPTSKAWARLFSCTIFAELCVFVFGATDPS